MHVQCWLLWRWSGELYRLENDKFKTKQLPSPKKISLMLNVHVCACFKNPIPTFPFPDVDECDLGSYVCDVNAYCENTIGSYDCVCEDGYIENGTFCMSKLMMTTVPLGFKLS